MWAWMLFVVLFDERVGILDYFKPSDSLIFFDELTRCTEQGKLTETEFSESMKQRLAMGYILPGQMNGLFTEKEIVAKLEKYSCIASLRSIIKQTDCTSWEAMVFTVRASAHTITALSF